MTKIEIYDFNYKELRKMAEEEDTTIAEIVDDIIEAYKTHVLNED